MSGRDRIGSIWLQSPDSPTTPGSDVAFYAFVITMPGHSVLFSLSFDRQASEPKNSMQSSTALVLCLFLLYQERYIKFLFCDLERLAHWEERDDTFSDRTGRTCIRTVAELLEQETPKQNSSNKVRVYFSFTY